MPEFCHLCKMEVESIKVHWKFNHKKLKMSKKNKKSQVGWMDKRQKGLSTTEKSREVQEEELRTCSLCGAKNILNMDQHILLKHRTKKAVPSVDSTEEDAAERVRKKLNVFRTQRKFANEFSNIDDMRQNSEERVKLYKEVISSICSDNTIPQLVVCPFCKKTLFYGLITSRFLADKIKGPVRNHLEKCDPLAPSETSNKENPGFDKMKTEVDWTTIKKRPKKGVKYVEIDGKKIPAAVYPSCDALGNPLDLNSPGSQHFLKLEDTDFCLHPSVKLEQGASAIIPLIETGIKTEKIESNETDDKVKLEPEEEDTLEIDMSESIDIKKEIFAEYSPETPSCNETEMVEETSASTVLEEEIDQSSSVQSEKKIFGLSVRKDLMCSS